MDKNKVSVVITAYNVSEFIKECVESVYSQTLPCDIVVVEDKSTDNTLEVLKSIPVKSDFSFKIIENEENLGAGHSRNIGISNCDTEYVLLLDGDDYYSNSRFIEDLVRKAEETGADIVSGGITIKREDGSWDATSYGNCVCINSVDKVAKFWGERIVFMNNKLIRKKIHDIVPYCKRRYIEDTPVIIPQLWHANAVVYCDNIGYVYRMRNSSLTHTSNPIKDVIYKGLCWIDLLEFFNKNDKELFKAINLNNYIINILNVLNDIEITDEMLKPYEKEWFEFSRKLFNVMKINNIDIVGREKY